MKFSFYLESDTLSNLAESLLLFVACVFLGRILFSRGKRGVTGLRWLIPFGIFVLIELADEVIYTFYLLTQNGEPDPASTITDIAEVIAMASLLYAMISLWRTIRDKAYLASPLINKQQVSDDIEGVWPPPPSRTI